VSPERHESEEAGRMPAFRGANTSWLSVSPERHESEEAGRMPALPGQTVKKMKSIVLVFGPCYKTVPHYCPSQSTRCRTSDSLNRSSRVP